MAVNGISLSTPANRNDVSPQLNFNRFTNDVMLDHMDRVNEAQTAISQDLRDIIQNRRNDDDGINFNLYSKEDEKKNSEDTHMTISNPGQSITPITV